MNIRIKTPFGYVTAAVVAVLVAAAVSCGDDPVQPGEDRLPDLVGTSWELDFVESISDNFFFQFNDNGEGIWQVPDDDRYLLEFNADSTVYVLLSCEECEVPVSNFHIAEPDSMSIHIECPLDVVCGKNVAIDTRLFQVEAFEKGPRLLRLKYNMNPNDEEEGDGILHYVKITEDKP